MTRTKRPEDRLQQDVLAFFARALPKLAVWHHSPNGKPSNAITGARFKRLGVRAGWPDLEIMWDGRAHFIELKAPRGRLSQAQTETLDALRTAGCATAVCTSLGAVEAVLVDWDIPLRARLT